MKPVYKLGAIKRRREQIALQAAEKFAAPLRAIAADVLRVHELQCAGTFLEPTSQVQQRVDVNTVCGEVAA